MAAPRACSKKSTCSRQSSCFRRRRWVCAAERGEVCRIMAGPALVPCELASGASLVCSTPQGSPAYRARWPRTAGSGAPGGAAAARQHAAGDAQRAHARDAPGLAGYQSAVQRRCGSWLPKPDTVALASLCCGWRRHLPGQAACSTVAGNIGQPTVPRDCSTQGVTHAGAHDPAAGSGAPGAQLLRALRAELPRAPLPLPGPACAGRLAPQATAAASPCTLTRMLRWTRAR